MKTTGTQWPHLLADLQAKRDALEQLIGIIREHFVGDDPGEMPESPRTNGRAKKTDVRKKGRPRVSDMSADGSVVIAAIRKAGGAMAPRELARALDLDIGVLRYRLRPLVEAGTVVVTGATATRRVSLPGKTPAKEGL